MAERFGKLFRHTVGQARKLSDGARARKIAVWRRRLWDLSWFMRCLNESIARRANREDRCTGRFWEGRFRSQALLDEGALLTCMTYVDLNPIRAGVAATLEDSEFTSIRERLLAAARGSEAVWDRALVPFSDQVGGEVEHVPMPFADYVELLRATAAAIREERVEGLPPAVAASLERLGLRSGSFVDNVRHYARRFFTMVGQVHRINVESGRRGYRRRPGVQAAKRMYRRAAA